MRLSAADTDATPFGRNVDFIPPLLQRESDNPRGDEPSTHRKAAYAIPQSLPQPLSSRPSAEFVKSVHNQEDLPKLKQSSYRRRITFQYIAAFRIRLEVGSPQGLPAVDMGEIKIAKNERKRNQRANGCLDLIFAALSESKHQLLNKGRLPSARVTQYAQAL
jgi:hypothetical protein